MAAEPAPQVHVPASHPSGVAASGLRFVAIGASGSEGLADIVALLHGLRQPIGAAVLVVLHRPSDRTSFLKEVLARRCAFPVVVAQEAQFLIAGSCYIGEPAGHLSLINHDVAHLVRGADHRLRGRTIDTLFISLAEHAGPRVVGIVLSGALDDGSRGLAAIHAHGGTTMVLEPGDKPRGMQQNAIDYDGPISLVGNSRQITVAINELITPA